MNIPPGYKQLKLGEVMLGTDTVWSGSSESWVIREHNKLYRNSVGEKYDSTCHNVTIRADKDFVKPKKEYIHGM